VIGASGATRSALVRYYCYTATTYGSFIAPIWILFVRSRGVSFAEIGALNALFWIALVFGEIPTGYVGDRVGRRNSLLLGTVVLTVASVALAFSNSFLSFAVIWSLWALGLTFRSGSDDAWLYDLLAADDRTTEFARVRGRAAALGLSVGAITAPVGGYLADVDFRYPFFAGAALAAVGGVVLLTLPESVDGNANDGSDGSDGSDGNGEDDARNEGEERDASADGEIASGSEPGRDSKRDSETTFDVREALAVIRTTLARPPLASFVLYFALLYGVLNVAYIFDQPITRDVALGLGVPESATKTAVGIVYAGFTAASALVSYYTEAIEKRVGIERWFAWCPLVVGATFAVLWLVPLAAIPAFLVGRMVMTASVTLGNQYVNDRVPSVGRATVLSAASMLYALAAIPFEIGGGLIADALSPTVAMAVLGAVLVVASLAIRVLARPVR